MGNNRTRAEEGLKYNRARVTNTTRGEEGRQIQKGGGLQIQDEGERVRDTKHLKTRALVYCKQNGSAGLGLGLRVKNSPFPSCN